MRYDFYCKDESCGEVLRDVDMLSTDPYPSCPKCGKPVERLFDQQNITLRGLTTPGRGS
ncbi:Zinc ribbon domain protein [uncultured archaeon]|nr:Zinc ribbon domain protein [uncultured archaeon]